MGRVVCSQELSAYDSSRLAIRSELRNSLIGDGRHEAGWFLVSVMGSIAVSELVALEVTALRG